MSSSFKACHELVIICPVEL